MWEVDSAFARQGWRGCRGSLIIAVERRVHELKCGGIKTLQMCVLATPLECDRRCMPFLIETKSLLTSPGKMIGAQYKIKVIAQAEIIRYTRDLWTFCSYLL